MTDSSRNKLHSLLFAEGRELVNIKFMPGFHTGLTPTALADAAARAIDSAIDGGLVDNPPHTGLTPCKLDAFY